MTQTSLLNLKWSKLVCFNSLPYGYLQYLWTESRAFRAIATARRGVITSDDEHSFLPALRPAQSSRPPASHRARHADRRLPLPAGRAGRRPVHERPDPALQRARARSAERERTRPGVADRRGRDRHGAAAPQRAAAPGPRAGEERRSCQVGRRTTRHPLMMDSPRLKN